MADVADDLLRVAAAALQDTLTEQDLTRLADLVRMGAAALWPADREAGGQLYDLESLLRDAAAERL